MKKSIKTALISAGVFAIGFMSVAFIGESFTSFVSANDADKINNYSSIEENMVKPDYDVNSSGKTYGDILNVRQEDYPDLIGVIATNGREGYAYKEDFCDEYIPESAEDAVDYMNKLKELNEQGIYFRVIPVYDSNGRAVIGEYEINIDVGLCFDGSVDEKSMTEMVLEREKIYEESRKQGKVLKGSIRAIME